MAPVLSKSTRAGRRSSRGPHDVVFFVATEKVLPAFEGLLRALDEGADGLCALAGAAVTGASAGTSAAATEVAELLSAVTGLTGKALQGAASDVGQLLCNGLGFSLKGFLLGEGQSLSEKLPLIFILWLLQLLYGAFVFAYMPAAGIAFNSPTSMIFHAFIFLTLASFFKAANTDPGRVPGSSAWRRCGRPPQALMDQVGAEGARWCEHEECYKPPRAHHCRGLGANVLRMDHHCTWLGNTVGWENHKFFFLFLFYSSTASSFFGLNVLQLLVHATLPALTTFLLIGAEGLAVLLGGILGPFFLFHCWLLFNNMTTIEYCEGFRKPPREDAADSSSEADSKTAPGSQGPSEASTSPYDVGLYRNVCSVLGENPLLWWLPCGKPPGDGLSFPMSQPSLAATAAPSKSCSTADPEEDMEEEDLQSEKVGPFLVAEPVDTKKAASASAAAAAAAKVTAPAPDDFIFASLPGPCEPDPEFGVSSDASTVASMQDVASVSEFPGPGSGPAHHVLSADEDWEEEDDEEEEEEEEEAEVEHIDEDLQVGSSSGISDSDGLWAASAAAEFVEDFSLGFQTLAQAAGDAAWRFAWLCSPEPTAEAESKARSHRSRRGARLTGPALAHGTSAAGGKTPKPGL